MRRLLVVLLLLVVASCRPAEVDPPSEPARPVKVLTLKPGPFRATVPLLGVVAAGESIPIIAPQPGVARVPAGAAPLRGGERVRAGQALLLLEDETARHAAVQAELEHAQATTEANRLRRGSSDGVVAPVDLENAEARLRQSEEALVSARRRSATLVLSAPRDGMLAIDGVTPIGSLVQSGAVVARVVTADALRVEAVAAAADRTSLSPGLRATLIATGHPEGEGRVAEVAPVVDAAGTVRVVLDVVKWDDPPAPGEGADVIVELAERVDALTLPVAALSIGSGGASAFVVERAQWQQGGPSHRARRRNIVLGRRSAERVEVLSGLNDGDPVVVAGAELLADGDGVAIEQDAKAAAEEE